MLGKIKWKMRQTLYRWIILGCTALMIPTICAFINYYINKNLIEKKIDQVNQFMLENIKYNIDAKLEDMLNLSKQLLLDEQFTMNSLRTRDDKQFQERVLNCFERLKLSYRANSSMEVMLYIPERDFIIDSVTANTLESIYISLESRGRISVTQKEWREELGGIKQNGFLISDKLGYLNAGKECLVLVAPIMYSGIQEAGYAFISQSTEFLQSRLDRDINQNNTVLILDKHNRIIGRYGAGIAVTEVELGERASWDSFYFQAGGENYIGAGTASGVTGWNYVVCTPLRVYMEDAIRNRNVNLFIVLIGMILGIVVVILCQRRNYWPVQKLINILPDREEGFLEDEFALVENNLRRLYDENKSMKSSMEGRLKFEREMGLLSAMTGRGFFLNPLSMEELLGENYQRLKYCFVTIKLDLGEKHGPAMDSELLVFLIDNVIRDIFDERYRYMKTMDDRYLVCLFLLEPEDAGKGWGRLLREKFLWLNEFFQSRLELDLAVTLGEEFDAFDHVESAYARMQEVNEQRYYTVPYGVIGMEEAGQENFISAGRLNYYLKSFGEAARAADFTAAQDLSSRLFGELTKTGTSYNTALYFVLAIVNHILMCSRDMVKEEPQAFMEELLKNMREAESFSALKDEFCRFLGFICRRVDEVSGESSRLSESIKAYVRENYTDCNMNISAIGEKMNLTPRYMSRLFREQTGVSLLDFINEVRIGHARRLLKEGDKTVEEISDLTGFANVRTFRRNFFKAVGVTPANYRNKQQWAG